MITPLRLEAMNLVWFIGSMCVVLIFANLVCKRWHEGRTPALNAAIALCVYFSGEAIVRGWIWLWRYFQNRGHDTEWMMQVPVLIPGMIVAAIGLVCIIRCFTIRYGHLAWGVTAAIMFAAAALTMF